MYLIVIVLIGVAGWFFVQKTRNVANNSSDDSGLAGLVASKEPSPLPEDDNGSKEGAWIKLPSGLQLQDLVIGYGQEAKEGDVVAAHYSGTLADGTKFDSSYDRGEPYAFILGGGMVIKGWDLGLIGMKVGGKRKLVIPPELGYGNSGAGGIIPPNATLYFDIELMAVETPKAQKK
jgi:FKBP-type peptidyl-prolyl cis-trans isomerase